MVGRQTLDLVVEVRVLLPQPVYFLWRHRLGDQDRWFSAIRPGFESPWRHHKVN